MTSFILIYWCQLNIHYFYYYTPIPKFINNSQPVERILIRSYHGYKLFETSYFDKINKLKELNDYIQTEFSIQSDMYSAKFSK